MKTHTAAPARWLVSAALLCHPAAEAPVLPMSLGTPFAKKLSDLLHPGLGLVFSFIDADGRIMASSERQRLESIHRIAQRIARCEMEEYRVGAEEAWQSSTVRKGINMGIDLADRRPACFAIAGTLDVVRLLTQIVCFCRTSLLQIRQVEPPALAPQTPGTSSDFYIALGVQPDLLVRTGQG